MSREDEKEIVIKKIIRKVTHDISMQKTEIQLAIVKLRSQDLDIVKLIYQLCIEIGSNDVMKFVSCL